MEKNLQQEEALAKFKKLVEEIKVCMFITNTREEHEHTRPMWVIDCAEDGTLWFFTDIRSIKVEEVASERKAHLTFAHPPKQSYLDVWGDAEVVTDRATIDEKWDPFVKTWFPEGKNSPNVGLLRVRPTEVYYWEAESGRMVHWLKVAAAFVTGNDDLAKDAQGRLSM